MQKYSNLGDKILLSFSSFTGHCFLYFGLFLHNRTNDNNISRQLFWVTLSARKTLLLLLHPKTVLSTSLLFD